MLKPWLEGHEHLPILVSKTGRPLTETAFRHIMRDAHDAAGLPDDATTHGLRVTAGVIIYQKTGDWQIVGSILGHQTEAMVRHYLRQQRFGSAAVLALDQRDD